MKNIFLFLFLFVVTTSSFSQLYNPEKVDKKAIAVYNQALEKAQGGNLKEAATLLLQAISIDPKYTDAYLSIAGVYGQMKDYPNSISYYEKSFAQDSDYTIEYKLPYSINLAGSGQFDKALDAINHFLSKNPPQASSGYKAALYRKKAYEF